MIIRTQKRPGVTLIEVLVATGILAIGIISIMALFPIGAVSMVRAINQNRASDHAANSDAMLRYYWKQAWIDPNGGGVRSSNDAYAASFIMPANVGEDMIPLLDRRRPFNFANPPDISANSSQPSFPVLIDPIGYRTQGNFGPANTFYVGGQALLPARCSLATAEADTLFPSRTRVRVTTLLDDMTFDNNGEPSAASGQLERAGRYNVAWMIQRPKNNIPHEVHVRVLVFAGRSPTDTPSSEQFMPATAYNYFDGVDPKPNSITIPLNGQPKPAIRKGSWVAFTVALQPRGGGTPIPGFDFYRVSAITDDSSTRISVEFEQPLRSYTSFDFAGGYNYDIVSNTAVPGALTGAVVVFDNLIEVFDRGIMSATGISGR